MTALAGREPVGMLVRRWRERRRRSQLDVSSAAGMSPRHLSFVETGRANPSRTMIERICDELEVPLRERNAFYLAAGFAPVYQESSFDDLGPALDAVRQVLTGLEPNPAVAINVRWELLAANQAMQRFLTGIPDELTGPPLNMLRATLHPNGLAPGIKNLAEWKTHLIHRVRRQLARTNAPGLTELLADLQSYPAPTPAEPTPPANLITPLTLATAHGDLSLIYTSTVFGSPRDVTLDEIAIETFFPADPATADLLHQLSGQTLNLNSTTSPSRIT